MSRPQQGKVVITNGGNVDIEFYLYGYKYQRIILANLFQ